MTTTQLAMFERAATVAYGRHELFILVHYAEGWAVPRRPSDDHDGAWPTRFQHPIQCFPTVEEAVSHYLDLEERARTRSAYQKNLDLHWLEERLLSSIRTRVMRVVRNAGLSNIWEIEQIPDSEWCKHKNFGSACLRELRALVPYVPRTRETA